MKNTILICFLLLIGCAEQTKRSTVTISSSNLGLVKNQFLTNPLYITSEIEEKNIPENALKIHQGHFLSIKNTKAQNELILESLEKKLFHLVNLSLEDIAVAEQQEIKFQNYTKLIFLNSSVTDVSRDDLYGQSNVLPFYVFEGVVFIGLSDKQFAKNTNTDRFIINDYIFSVLKAKKLTLNGNYNSYIIIHHFGSEINDIMDRLPPTFSNSLAN